MNKALETLAQLAPPTLVAVNASLAAATPALPTAVVEAACDTAKHAHAVKAATKYAQDHPVIIGCVVGGALAAVAPQVVAVPALNAAGFTQGGVAANSIAAGVHSMIGNVVSGSAFATLQSAGAGGAGAALVNGVTQLAGSGAAAAAVGRAIWGKANSEEKA